MSNANAKKCPKCGKVTLAPIGRAQSGKQRWRCGGGGTGRPYCYSTTNPSLPARDRTGKILESEAPARFNLKLRGKKRLVVTWAQNATPVHSGFFAALQTYCDENNAQLVVIPGRYKNPTSRWEESQLNSQWWEEPLVPYLCNQRKKLNRHLILIGDVCTQPTAVSPLSGFEALSHGESAIFGHPKLQMKTIPTPQSKLPKILTTTGAVTVANYTDTKAGKKGEFHHVLGATVVELDRRGLFHLRQINARSDGAFCDLDRAYYPDGTVEASGPYEAVILGDSHVRFNDPVVDEATFGEDGLVELLNPKALVFHDLFDGHTVNPHHVGRPFISVAKSKAKRSDVAVEVVEAIEWLVRRVGDRRGIVVASNHDEFLRRWIERTDWRFDPENAEFYLQTALHMVRSARLEDSGAVVDDPFQFWVRQYVKPEAIQCVPRGASLMIADVECALHGDQGPNGSRGSRKNLSRIGVKTFVAHGHGPGIEEGAYQVGTSTPLSLEYTGGPGSWLNTHGSIDAFGKRHLHTIIIEGNRGKFRL